MIFSQLKGGRRNRGRPEGCAFEVNDAEEWRPPKLGVQCKAPTHATAIPLPEFLRPGLRLKNLRRYLEGTFGAQAHDRVTTGGQATWLDGATGVVCAQDGVQRQEERRRRSESL